MPAPATHDFVHLEISSASVLNTSVNGPLNYLIGRDLGSDDAIELEDSLEILSGSGGRYLRLPQGTTGQRPTGAAGMLRLNTTLGLPWITMTVRTGISRSLPDQPWLHSRTWTTMAMLGVERGPTSTEGDHEHHASQFLHYILLCRGHWSNRQDSSQYRAIFDW